MWHNEKRNQLVLSPTQLLTNLQSGQLYQIRAPRGSFAIICHRHHAEIAGPGAAVGGALDLDCHRLIPVGTVALAYPESREERQQARLMRQKWLKATQKLMDNPVPLKRAILLLRGLEKYCGSIALNSLSDEVLAQLIGVLPKTMTMARQSLNTPVPKTFQMQGNVVVSK
ncbi:MAG: hypothetical protein ACOC0N_05265 [Chroococcales cyanobacterium]